jgi:ribosomal protein S16
MNSLAQQLNVLLAKTAKAMEFDVSVVKMTESHRITWWVVITNSDRPEDAGMMDNVGKLTPFYSTDSKQAIVTAANYALFLGAKSVYLPEELQNIELDDIDWYLIKES